MNNIEKIKFGDQAFDLVPDGIKLGETGGTVTFQKGSASFDSVKALLKANGEIAQIGLSGDTDWAREDLVYAKRLTEESDYVIGKDEDGVTDRKADVIIAYFKTPDLQERVAALEAENAEIKKDNESLKTTVGTLVLSSLEV
ncbi:hypothetical protein BXY41_11627 [Lacrimispora xylanisolvens]|uniref:Uncharacterized protein n=1 Tax=Lacrimispora xylanisolvens TaxID=384636 RepID=A0A2S6HJ37_9FIRM|nr:hypothetical protein [Hungatella xylanolytica]PPK77489.1 hypothetical protein BXY41_11627 [Hungatella xylanolytica]